MKRKMELKKIISFLKKFRIYFAKVLRLVERIGKKIDEYLVKAIYWLEEVDKPE